VSDHHDRASRSCGEEVGGEGGRGRLVQMLRRLVEDDHRGVGQQRVERHAVYGLFANPDDREEMGRRLQRDGWVRDFEVPLRNRAGELSYGLISATVTQVGGEPQVIKGDAVIKKKDKFRVHYTEPNEQIMISDGKTIYVYTPSLNQAIKQSVASANANTKFYTDFSSSLNHYVKNSSTEVTEDDSSYTFSMVPENKKELDYDSIAVKVSKKDLMPYSMTMKVQGTVSEVEFSETVNYTADEAADNADLADKNFEFKAPDGVEVIDSAELMQGVK